MTTQSNRFQPGEKAKFNLKDVSAEEFAENLPFSNDKMMSLNRSDVKILGHSKDVEYYDIEFAEGTKVKSVSGYHLDYIRA